MVRVLWSVGYSPEYLTRGVWRVARGSWYARCVLGFVNEGKVCCWWFMKPFVRARVCLRAGAPARLRASGECLHLRGLQPQ